MRRLLAFLGVQPTEARLAIMMLAHSFFMGCATVFFETAASATFLSRFASSWLPWVYIAAAGVNTVTGGIYARAQGRLTFAHLMKGTLSFLFVLVLAVRLGLAVSDLPWVAFAGLVAYRVISSLTDLEYWAVASRIYDVGQAKRLFGLIGTGEVVARIAGALCVPLFVRFSGVANLMLLSAAGLALCLFFLGRIIRHAAMAAPSQRAPETRSLREGIREIVSSRYLVLVVGVAVLATFGKYFVDFAFLEQIGSLATGEKEIASVLGIFSGVTQALSLFTRVFISRALLSRIGIRATVLVLPLAHLACCALVLAAGALGQSTAVFWLVIANQGIYKTLKHPIDNASFKVLYQPLQRRQRLSAQIAVEVIFSPVVVGVAGVVMLLFTTVLRYDPVRFAVVLFFVFAAWAATARSAGRAYARKILDLLRPPTVADPVASISLPPEDLSTQLRAEAEKLSLLVAKPCDANREAIRLGRERIMRLLAHVHDRESIQSIALNIGHPSKEKRAFARELLELVLDRELRALLIPVLADDG